MLGVTDPASDARQKADELRRKVYPDLYPEDGADANTEDGTQDSQADAQQEQEPQQSAEPEPQVQQQDDPNSETWKQRYQTIDGKYRNEVPRLQEQVSRLLEQLDQATAKASEAKEPQQQTAPLSESLLQLQELYGDNFVEAIKSIVRAENEESVKPLRNEVENATQQVSQMGFYANLDRAADGWRQLNEDPQFIAWLEKSDPVTGIDYHSVLMSHFERGDYHKTAAVFNYYKDLASAAQPVQKRQAKTPDELVAPRKTGGGTQSVVDNNAGDVMSMTAYEQLQREYLNGAFKGKETEYRNKKASFLRAAQEGRLI